MELANLSAEVRETVRVAEKGDSGVIMRLLQRAAFTHYHVDWRLPGDWIGTDGFVVQREVAERDGRWGKWRLPGLRGCLAVGGGPPPAAWVRVAAIHGHQRPEMTLAVLLAGVVPFLQKTAVSQLGWLTVEAWPDPWLPQLGFRQISRLDGYYKQTVQTHPVPTLPDITIQPMQVADIPALAAIEEAAYAPLWRHSTLALHQASKQAFSFDTVRYCNQIVGFQVSTRSKQSNAHLARMSIHPDYQGQGIGSVLLAHTLAQYQQAGIRSVSLNTQADNWAAQRLYKKFGFQANGEQIPIWCLDMAPE